MFSWEFCNILRKCYFSEHELKTDFRVVNQVPKPNVCYNKNDFWMHELVKAKTDRIFEVNYIDKVKQIKKTNRKNKSRTKNNLVCYSVIYSAVLYLLLVIVVFLF